MPATSFRIGSRRMARYNPRASLLTSGLSAGAPGRPRLFAGNAAAAATRARAMMPATTWSDNCATGGAARHAAVRVSTADMPAQVSGWATH